MLPSRFQDWFAAKGWTARPHQLALVEHAAAGRSVLLVAPTGGGKTLAGFLPSLIDLAETPKRAAGPQTAHALYLAAEGAGGGRGAQSGNAGRRNGTCR